MANRIQQQAILDKYFAPKLSKKALRQLKSAVAKPQNQFAEALLLIRWCWRSILQSFLIAFGLHGSRPHTLAERQRGAARRGH